VSADPLTPVSQVAAAIALTDPRGFTLDEVRTSSLDVVEIHGEALEPPVRAVSTLPLELSGIVSGARVRIHGPSGDATALPAGLVGGHLVLALEADHSEERIVSLASGLHLIGRADDNELVLNEHAVSAHHCRVEVGSFATLTDLSSISGTRVNGRPVVKAVLRSGDGIQIGDSALRVVSVPDQLNHGLPRRTVQVFRSPLAMTVEQLPPSSTVLNHVFNRGPLLWSRTQEADTFLTFRLGTTHGEPAPVVPAGTSTEGGRAADSTEVERTATSLPGSPMGVNLSRGALGIAGPVEPARSLIQSIAIQAAALHSPEELAIVSLLAPLDLDAANWLRWLPHVAFPEGGRDGTAIASDAEDAQSLVHELETVMTVRLTNARARLTTTGEPYSLDQPPRTVLVLVSSAPAELRPRLARLARVGSQVGLHVLWQEPEPEHLPSACGEYCVLQSAAVGAQSTGTFWSRSGSHDFVAESVDGVEVERAARVLAPLVDGDVWRSQRFPPPTSVGFTQLMGDYELGDTAGIRERWTERQERPWPRGELRWRSRASMALRTRVGVSEDGPVSLDLTLHGPHAFITGTTGSGKTSLLETWLLGMALTQSPDQLNLLLVDYKGGASFGDLRSLPHVAGFVTEIPRRSQLRLATFLESEIRSRVDLLRSRSAPSFDSLERRGESGAPPRLVIAVDELAPLRAERTDLVDRLGELLRQGRFLGIHLIATSQDAAAASSSSFSGLWGLRIALRTVSEAASVDVIGDPRAAHFDPSTPGRGTVRFPGGRLADFQSAYAGYLGSNPVSPTVQVRSEGLRGSTTWEYPQPAEQPLQEPVVARIARDMVSVAAEICTPVKNVWLDELASTYDLLKLGRPQQAGELFLGVRDRPQDMTQAPLAYRPDSEGNVAVIGASGSGKTCTLRSLAVAACLASVHEPVEVYGLDFGGGGLQLLADMPHVGSIVPGERDRARRVIDMLTKLVAVRSEQFARGHAATIQDFRTLGHQDAARVLLLVDDMESLYSDFASCGLAGTLKELEEVAISGRPVGVHIAASWTTLERIPPSLLWAFQVLALQLHDDGDASDEDRGTFPSTMPLRPGHGVYDGDVVQIAVPGGDPSVAQQHRAIYEFSEAMIRHFRFPQAAAVRSLDDPVWLDDLPVRPGESVPIGLDGELLEPVGIDPNGLFMIAGPPRSGKTTALHTIAVTARRSFANARIVLMSRYPTSLAAAGLFDEEATNPASVADLALSLKARLDDPGEGATRLIVFVEDIPSLVGTEADEPLRALVDLCDQHGELVVGVGDTTRWTAPSPILRLFRASRRGLILGEPDSSDAELLGTVAEVSGGFRFPPGRGRLVDWGRSTSVVQVAQPISAPATP